MPLFFWCIHHFFLCVGIEVTTISFWDYLIFKQSIFTISKTHPQLLRQKVCKKISVKLTFSEKATKIDKLFTVNLTVCSNRQIDVEDFFNFCELLKTWTLIKLRDAETIADFRIRGKARSYVPSYWVTSILPSL